MNIEKKYIDAIILREGNGKFTDDPKDSGGATRWGVTEKEARAWGYLGNMRYLPRSVAYDILRSKFWLRHGIFRINEVFPALAERMLDFGVLAGPQTSVKFLQRCLNVLNRNGRDYPDIGVDGAVGEKQTIPSLEAFLKFREEDGKKVLLGAVTSLQSSYLIELAERRPKDEEYEYGWQLNRAIGAIL
jgi:lysozyme family protein